MGIHAGTQVDVDRHERTIARVGENMLSHHTGPGLDGAQYRVSSVLLGDCYVMLIILLKFKGDDHTVKEGHAVGGC